MSERPRVLYDLDCGFCRWALAWILRWDRRRRLQPIPIERHIQRPEDLDSWHFERGGRRWSGGKAFAPLLEELPGGRVLAPLARRLEWLSVPVYRWVADHRSALSKLVPAGSKRRADEVVRVRAYDRM